MVLHYDLPGVGLEEVCYHVNELPYGAFGRSVTVPERVDADAIKSSFENGVLEVVLPGAVQEVQPKRIAIETGKEGPQQVEG